MPAQVKFWGTFIGKVVLLFASAGASWTLYHISTQIENAIEIMRDTKQTVAIISQGIAYDDKELADHENRLRTLESRRSAQQ